MKSAYLHKLKIKKLRRQILKGIDRKKKMLKTKIILWFKFFDSML